MRPWKNRTEHVVSGTRQKRGWVWRTITRKTGGEGVGGEAEGGGTEVEREGGRGRDIRREGNKFSHLFCHSWFT